LGGNTRYEIAHDTSVEDLVEVQETLGNLLDEVGTLEVDLSEDA
jgi:hypothetical protein